MKKFNFLLYSMSIMLLIQCSDDDKKRRVTYKDQDASGKIANADWAYADGYAGLYTDGGETVLSVWLTLKQDLSGCKIFRPVGNILFFDVPPATGVYELSIDPNTTNGSSLTFWDDTEGVNIVASEGAIEILEITKTLVKGRINASSGTENYINGNFTVGICAR